MIEWGSWRAESPMISIAQGKRSGAFIIDTVKRNEILVHCQSDDERKRTEELIRPNKGLSMRFYRP